MDTLNLDSPQNKSHILSIYYVHVKKKGEKKNKKEKSF